MAQDSKIEWTHHTANLWHGCTKVHEGCDHCYAETLAKRWGNDIWGNDKPRKEIKSFFNDLDKYQKLAKEAGETHKVFVGSMMDIFEKTMPLVNSKGEEISYTTGDIRNTFFHRIMGNYYPNLMFLLLTKRPSNINKMIPELWKTEPPQNVMFGCSPVNQKTAEKLIPQLLQVKGNHFLSIEPMLGPIDLEHYEETGQPTGFLEHIKWVIVGGESGHHKRPFDPYWARNVRDLCADYKVAFFMKQMNKILTIPEDLLIRQFP